MSVIRYIRLFLTELLLDLSDQVSKSNSVNRYSGLKKT